MSQAIRQKAITEPIESREDSLLFRTAIVTIAVEVTPQRRRTAAGDQVLRGFIGDKEIEVVFAGRRQGAAMPLMRMLQAKAQAVRLRAEAGGRAAPFGNMRHRLRVEGVWRARLLTEGRGMPERRFQLVAARWRYRGGDGAEQVHGYLPSG